MFFERWFGLNAKRLRLLEKAPKGPLKDFLAVPFPESDTPIKHVDMLALDFETTGLQPSKDHILSMGFTSLSNGVITLKDSQHLLVNNQMNLDRDNVKIHQITDSEQASGEPLAVVVEALLQQLAGKVMLVHYAQVERTFLQQACLHLYGMVPVFPIIDTLLVAKRRFDLSDTSYDPSRLRLVNLREEFQLPAHHEHNALNDAIATGELLLAQLQQSEQGMNTPLKNLLV